MTSAGLPHSGTPGSLAACASPGSIAACRALHRLSVPRHPPCALVSLGRIFHRPPKALPYQTHVRDRRMRDPPVRHSHFLIPTTRVVKVKTGIVEMASCLFVCSGPPLKGPSRGVRLGSFAFDAPRGAYSQCSRKEVIQPQVPLRLPCYDFAPVTELAFGGSFPCGLGHGLRALPTPMA